MRAIALRSGSAARGLVLVRERLGTRKASREGVEGVRGWRREDGGTLGARAPDGGNGEVDA